MTECDGWCSEAASSLQSDLIGYGFIKTRLPLIGSFVVLA